MWGKIWIEWVEEELKYKKRGRKYNGKVVGDKEVKKKGKGWKKCNSRFVN